MLIAIAALNNLNISQIDVKTVFLNGELNEKNIHWTTWRAGLSQNPWSINLRLMTNYLFSKQSPGIQELMLPTNAILDSNNDKLTYD